MIELVLSIVAAIVLITIGFVMLARVIVHWRAISTMLLLLVAIAIIGGCVWVIYRDTPGALALGLMTACALAIGYALTEGVPRLLRLVRAWRERPHQ